MKMNQYAVLTSKIETLLKVAKKATNPDFAKIWKDKVIELEITRDNFFIESLKTK